MVSSRDEGERYFELWADGGAGDADGQLFDATSGVVAGHSAERAPKLRDLQQQ